MKQHNVIEKVVEELYQKHEKEIEKKIANFSEVWNKVNDGYMTSISNYLNTDWEDDTKIIAKVAYVPICPRYLDEKMFIISANANDYYVREITAHECLHFIWFKKYKELYPEVDKIEYNSPYVGNIVRW